MRIRDLFEDHWQDERADRDYWDDVQSELKFGRDPEFQPPYKSWPPTAQEMREIERGILQNPAWLARYAYFGWRSWTTVRDHQWRFDKDKLVFRFSDVPFLGHMPDGRIFPDRNTLMIDLEGHVVHGKATAFDEHFIVLPSALDTCRRFALSKAKALRDNIHFLTGTYYIRFGKWPQDERSQNFLRGYHEKAPSYEAGVSAYHCFYDVHEGRWQIELTVNDDTVTGTMSSLIYGNREIYLVQGRELKVTGSDGEPLLKDVKAVKTLNKGEVFVAGVFDPLNDG